MPSRDEIFSIYQSGPEALVAWVERWLGNQAQRGQQGQVLTGPLTELEARLNKNSHNSHKPPSSDGPAKRSRPHSLRKRSGRKSGGQTGHPGVTRCLVDDPDLIVEHVPTVCTGCGVGLEAAPEISRERRQVIEIPRPRPEVTEHQAARLVCPVCQTVTAGSFPPEVSQ